MTEQVKRAVSFAVLVLGIVGGLVGCLPYPAAMFSIGPRDCPQELWAITFAFATPLPTCVLALWKRLPAGLWLVFAGCFLPYGMLSERTYLMQQKIFPYQPDYPFQPTPFETVKGSLPVCFGLVGIGVFFTVTSLLKWPKLLESNAKIQKIIDEQST